MFFDLILLTPGIQHWQVKCESARLGTIYDPIYVKA